MTAIRRTKVMAASRTLVEFIALSWRAILAGVVLQAHAIEEKANEEQRDKKSGRRQPNGRKAGCRYNRR